MNYHSPADYGLIGNRGSSALVSRLGCIEWCCLPYLDSPAHFASLHDELEGGRFSVAPVGEFRSEQRYLQRTHVLETLFQSPSGRATLTDWMPLEGDGTSPVIHRRLEITEGKLTFAVRCAPRFRHGSVQSRAEHSRGGLLFRGDSLDDCARLRSSRPLEISADTATGRWEMEAGEKLHFSWHWGRGLLAASDADPRLAAPDATVELWRANAHRCAPEGCPFSGPWHDAVVRADLLLQVLITPYSGAMADSVAHFATLGPGLPARPSRHASLRDAPLTLRALAALGRPEAARRYFEFVSDVILRDGAESLQPAYTLDGGETSGERELAGSRRFYLDIYGQAVLAASEYQDLFGELPPRLWERVAEIAEYISQAWKRPDFGPSHLEPRGRAEHYVSSKLHCWAALDRAIRLSHAAGMSAPKRWTSERDIIHRTICQQGYDETKNCFIRAFGDLELDPGAALLPLLEFLPCDDPRVQTTLSALQCDLSDGVFLYRQRGLEGAQLAPSLQFVACLALSGRVDEASDRLAELCTYATPLGFFGDRITAHGRSTGASADWSGAFPSASSSLALVGAALAIARAKGRRVPAPAALTQSLSPATASPNKQLIA